MKLTREQFSILEALAALEERPDLISARDKAAHNSGKFCGAVRELSDRHLVSNGFITGEGLKALQPYRVKRAIFLAAGTGSRMLPITINTPKPLVRVHGIRIIDRLIDACLAAGIREIYIVRGYLSEQFDQLVWKYPMVRFIENAAYDRANNILSALLAENLLKNAYVLEADLLIYNAEIIRKYQYASNFLAIRKQYTDDWCFEVQDGKIVSEKLGGKDCWQMVGISYWNGTDGRKLSLDIPEVYSSPGGKELYWEQVPLTERKEHYIVEVRECSEADIVEIDTFQELKAVDPHYRIQGEATDE